MWTREEKTAAYNIMNKAIKEGRIPPAKNLHCENCQKLGSEYHHFKGYAVENALDVIPLCRQCHRRTHTIIGAYKNPDRHQRSISSYAKKETNTCMQFAQFVRKKSAELRRDFTLQEIADGSGVSKETVRRMLTGQARRINDSTIKGICQFFNVPKGPVPFIVYDGGQD